MSFECHICHETAVRPVRGFESVSRVTSDCRPWDKGGKIGICDECGCVQKVVDEKYHADCNAIYNSYAVYYQGEGKEQCVFDQSDGKCIQRSELILNTVFHRYDLPSKGRLLDIGCGNGNLLRSFAKFRPLWSLEGSELDERYRKQVEAIENVEAFYTCHVKDIEGPFEMISMLHCLEHISDPIYFLKTVKEKIRHGGLLLIELPDYRQNPFDLVILDHRSHFTIETIQKLLWFSGYEVLAASNRYIPKEITVLARAGCAKNFDRGFGKNDISGDDISNALEWLKQSLHKASDVSHDSHFGIFGTSIAATWMCSELGDRVGFFVDEDPHRIGKKFMGRRIYHPEEIPVNWNVFIALPFFVAEKVWMRMKKYRANFHLPPDSEITVSV